MAVDELVRQISPALARYFGAFRAARNEVEDLVQDCWIRIHRSRHTYRPAEPVMPWVYAIARHTRLDTDKKRRRLESREVLVAEVPERAPAGSGAAEPDDFLARLIAALPDAQREVIVMLKVEGMTLQEVANATSCSVGAIKQRAHRAYAALRNAMAKGQERAE